jgi:phage terminase large subunit GpA-like protein
MTKISKSEPDTLPEHDEAVSNFRAALFNVRVGLKPPPDTNLADWADQHRRLSSKSGAIGGPWRTSVVEVARGPMMAVTEPGVRTITAMTCTQLLKTSLLENTIGRFANLDPCPMLLTQPKEGSVKAFSKERLVPMIKATPTLRKVFGDVRSRNSNDTMQYKDFPGGFLALESAGSPTNLAMRAIRITLLDEIDKYETTKEGDPVLLAEERTSTFVTNSLHIRTCSPTWEETSRIYRSYLESDQRRPFVKCPGCQYEQTLEFFAHVHWSRNEDGEHYPMTAAIFCEKCGCQWTEAQRLSIMQTVGAVRWRQTREFKCCDVVQKPIETRKWKWDAKNQVGLACCEHCEKPAVPNTHAGFTVSKLYSPFITIPELAQKWIDSKDDPESKQTFYNTQLGRPFKLSSAKKVETNALALRAEAYAAEVPMGACVLTAGIDIQSGSEVRTGRAEIEIVGWGIGEESWSIEHKIIEGDPSTAMFWRDVDAYLLKTWKHESGNLMVVRGACIDSGGHNTEDVYKFARARMSRRVWAIKGASDRSGQWSPTWAVPKLESGKTRVTGYKPQMIGVNSAKEVIANRLQLEDLGSGYCHFPVGRPNAYFDQLTSEDLITEKVKGTITKRWVLKRGRANEALDCRVYAYAALQGLYATAKINLSKIAAIIATPRTAAPVDDGLQVEGEVLEKAHQPTPRPPAPVVPARVRRSAFVG